LSEKVCAGFTRDPHKWTQSGLSTEPGALNAGDPKVHDWMVTDLPTDWKPEPFKGQTIDLGVVSCLPAARRRSLGRYRVLDPDRHRGVVYAFRGTTEDEKTYAYVLQGLEPSSRYVLKFNDHSSPDRTVTGDELMKRGLKMTLPIANSSELIFISMEGAAAR
jgi:hypothetical protein